MVFNATFNNISVILMEEKTTNLSHINNICTLGKNRGFIFYETKEHVEK